MQKVVSSRLNLLVETTPCPTMHGTSLTVRVESATDAPTCVPQSFSGSSVRDVVDSTYADGSTVTNAGIFGIGVQRLRAQKWIWERVTPGP